MSRRPFHGSPAHEQMVDEAAAFYGTPCSAEQQAGLERMADAADKRLADERAAKQAAADARSTVDIKMTTVDALAMGQQLRTLARHRLTPYGVRELCDRVGSQMVAAATLAMKVALMVALVACAGVDRPAPVVKLTFDQTAVPYNVADWTLTGADAWSQLGIVGDPTSTLPECPRAWFDDEASLPCAVTINVEFAPRSTMGGAAGLTDQHRNTILALEMSGDLLLSVAAHEIGHSLFASSDHLAPGDVGIMSAASHSITSPTDADVRYAIEHTHGMVGS